MALPEHTEVLFEEDAYGAMGDGYRLYAFSLPPGERDAFLSQGAMARWSPLPLPEDVAESLRQRVQAIGSLPGKELARDLFGAKLETGRVSTCTSFLAGPAIWGRAEPCAF